MHSELGSKGRKSYGKHINKIKKKKSSHGWVERTGIQRGIQWTKRQNDREDSEQTQDIK